MKMKKVNVVKSVSFRLLYDLPVNGRLEIVSSPYGLACRAWFISHGRRKYSSAFGCSAAVTLDYSSVDNLLSSAIRLLMRVGFRSGVAAPLEF